MEQDIIALQEIVLHQQDEITRISDELYTQQREIIALREEITLLRAMLKASAGEGFSLRSQEQETPPPHY